MGGWKKRGKKGGIGKNRNEGKKEAKQILEDLPEGSKPGRTALEAALSAKGARIVNYDDWRTLDAYEKAQARDGAPREKMITVAAMLGPTGNLRAPCIRVGKIVLVGFNEELFTDVLL